MKKIEEKNRKDSTFNKANDDEVLFILRGRDNSSPRVIINWIGVPILIVQYFFTAIHVIVHSVGI